MYENNEPFPWNWFYFVFMLDFLKPYIKAQMQMFQNNHIGIDPEIISVSLWILLPVLFQDVNVRVYSSLFQMNSESRFR